MIQDISPSVFYNHFEDLVASEKDVAVYFREGKLLCFYDEKNKGLRFPCVSDFSNSKSTYLFSIDKTKYFLIPEVTSIPEGLSVFSFYTPRQLRDMPLSSKVDIFAVFSAYHLWKWYDDNKFCGHCGHDLEHDTIERALYCPKCKSKIYPRINPAVIIGILNGDKILITKYLVLSIEKR